jgi:hypothetical protein
MGSSQARYSDEKTFCCRRGNRPFSSDIHQKSVNARQIIPVFIIVWDDDFKEQRGGTGRSSRAELVFFLSLCLSNHLARVHDEATTSDYGSDIGDQFNIVAGADEHDHKKTGG